MHRLTLPPKWRSHLIYPRTSYHSWLKNKGSLTRRIQQNCANFSVRRVSVRLGRPFHDEILALGLVHGRFVRLREVFLYCGNTPVVFARSVIPTQGKRGVWQHLGKLGNKPLGAALFANPLIKRAPLEFSRLDWRHSLRTRSSSVLPDYYGKLWARRSVFTLRNTPLLVTEVFLPAIAFPDART